MTDTIKQQDKYVFALLCCALACIFIAISFGVLSALYYLPQFAVIFKSHGISLTQLRPMHDTFISSWIFLCGIAMVYKYMIDEYGPLNPFEQFRYKLHMTMWGFAGLGIVISTLLGYSSGREYLSYPPFFSIFILAGWLLYAWNFLGRSLPGFWKKPVYVYMWTVSAFLFIYVFCEAHAYLIPSILHHPITDLQIQWKSYGALVASFNLLVYGSLMYMSEKISGDKKYAQSWKAFSLLGIGLLNSFTNYAHHTYHLPQSHLVKWISFLVSMAEIIILYCVMIDIVNSVRKKTSSQIKTTHHYFLYLSKNWTGLLLCVAILISIPSLNTLIHGTHVVTAHAMGSEIGIDTFALFAALSYLLHTWFSEIPAYADRLNGRRTQRIIFFMNLTFFALFSWLLFSGVSVGISGYLGTPRPWWVSYTPLMFACLGSLLALQFLYLLINWAQILYRTRRYFFVEQSTRHSHKETLYSMFFNGRS
jgi:nitric oxide reductase subunit B